MFGTFNSRLVCTNLGGTKERENSSSNIIRDRGRNYNYLFRNFGSFPHIRLLNEYGTRMHRGKAFGFNKENKLMDLLSCNFSV